MSKILFILFASILIAVSSQAQITLNSVHNLSPGAQVGCPFYLTKFNSLGYKYILQDNSTRTIKIYNLNNTLFLSIQIPTLALANAVAVEVHHISDNLFDLNNDIEYLLLTYSGPTITPKAYVFKDNGTQIFFRDSCNRIGTSNQVNNISENNDYVFFDGVSAKLKLPKVTGNGFINLVRYEVYNLPGTLPCVQCSSTGTVIGRPEYQGNNTSEPLFYPNPVNDQIKLKYDLPKNYKTAEIRVQDMQGKLLETYKVTSDFEFIYVPSNYNNGLYLYSLVVDGAVIKTEKIILSKN